MLYRELLYQITYLDGVVGEVEEPEADDVDGGGGPARSGERAAVLFGVAEVAPDVRREANHEHLDGPPASHQLKASRILESNETTSASRKKGNNGSRRHGKA